jgi:ribosomal protein L17
MTDVVTASIIGGLVASFASVMQFITVVKVNQIQTIAKRQEEHAKVVSEVVTKTQSDVVDLKRQTNGLTEALVAVTGQAEHAKGKLEGKIEGIAQEKANGGTG